MSWRRMPVSNTSTDLDERAMYAVRARRQPSRGPASGGPASLAGEEAVRRGALSRPKEGVVTLVETTEAAFDLGDLEERTLDEFATATSHSIHPRARERAPCPLSPLGGR